MIKNLRKHMIIKLKSGIVGDLWQSTIECYGYTQYKTKIFSGYTKKEIKSVFRKEWLKDING